MFTFAQRSIQAVVFCIVTLVALAGAEVLWDDFEVSNRNDNVQHTTARVAVADDGTYMVSWLAGNRIHARLFGADGVPVTDTFLVNHFYPVLGYHYAAAMNGAGVFAFVWIEDAATRRVMVRRYGSDGTPYDDYQCVQANQEGGATALRDPDIAVSSESIVYVTWRTDLSGKPVKVAAIPGLADPTPVVTHIDSLSGVPRIAAGDGGRCVVLATGRGAFEPTAVLLSFASSPTVLKPRFAVGQGPSLGGLDVAMRPDGEWVAIWEQSLSNETNIVLQRFTHEGSAIASSFYAENGYSASADKGPRVAYGSNGHIGAAWIDPIEGSVRYRAFSATGVAGKPSPTDVKEYPGESVGWADVAVTSGGAAHVVWDDNRLHRSDIYHRPLTSQGAFAGLVTRISVMGSLAVYPSVSLSNTHSFGVSVWENDGHIQAQFLDGAVRFRGYNTIVNSGSAGARPSVAVLDSAILIVWQDSSGGMQPRTSCRPYSLASPGGSSRILSNVGTIARHPAVAAAGDGFLVAWEHTTAANDTPSIRGQLVTAAGVPTGENFSIWAQSGKECVNPAVAGNAKGLAAVAWYINESSFIGDPIPRLVIRNDVYLRLYNASGEAVTDTIHVNDGGRTASLPSVAVDSSDRVAVAWVDSRSGMLANHVYCQFYESDGTPIGANFRVDTSDTACRSVSCAMADDGALMVVWQEAVTEKIMSRTINADGTFQGPVQRHNYAAVNMQVSRPRVSAGYDGALLVWTNCVPEDLSQRGIWGEFVTLRDDPATGALWPAVRMTAPVSGAAVGIRCDLLGRRIGPASGRGQRLPAGVYISGENGSRRLLRVR